MNIVKNEGSKANKGSQTPIFIQPVEKGDVIWLVFEVHDVILIHFGGNLLSYTLELTYVLQIVKEYEIKLPKN